MPFGSFIVTGIVRVSVLRCATPLRSTGGDDDCEAGFSPSGLLFNYAHLAFGFARKDFHRVLRLFCRGGHAVTSAVTRHDVPP